ncbi:hypothetical protein P4O66_008674 [Electrophorus voltai]|uniref:Myocilin n=1 Tax=Electrophorus voltai TaxID=2609070 RepID=A0AAD8ZD94_9TELE|nr:hypothetical protein P4O66_008674 [Electrophorus voltai]
MSEEKATVILEIHGYKMNTIKEQYPPWRRRLEAKIKATQKDVSQLPEMQKGTRGRGSPPGGGWGNERIGDDVAPLGKKQMHRQMAVLQKQVEELTVEVERLRERPCPLMQSTGSLSLISGNDEVWRPTYAKQGSEAFMVCGRLYMVASYSTNTTTLNHAYNMSNGWSTAARVAFRNPYRKNSRIDYNPAKKKLNWDSFHMADDR